MEQTRTESTRLISSPKHAPLGFLAFIALTASMMALNSLALDLMLPGFPQIRAALNIADPNAVQAVIAIYLIGFGVGQAFMGLLADRFGRRPIMISGITIYVIGAIWCVVTSDFSALLVARFVQGVASAAPRVVATAVIRDCYSGRVMAKVMSLNMMVFMAAPIVGPAIGQSILLIASWRWVFGFLAMYGAVVLMLGAKYLPETLHIKNQRKLDLVTIWAGLRSVFTSRKTVGYSLASSLMYGALMALISSSQQLMVGVFGLGVWYPAALASIAISLAFSQYFNSRLVERFGMRVMSFYATGLFLLATVIMVILSSLGQLGAISFFPLMALLVFARGIASVNFLALSLEDQGHIAGLATSLIGSVTVLIGATIGYKIGTAFDGTATPLVFGFFICGLATFAIIFTTEFARKTK